MKINFSNKIVVKNFCLFCIFCIAFIGCNDDDIDKSGKVSISIGDDSVFVLNDVGVGFIQLELTEPLEGSFCNVHLTSSIEESEHFSFPEFITLYEGTVRYKYPIYVKESKFSSPNEHITFTLDKVSNEELLAIDDTKKTVEFFIQGKDNAGKVFVGFEYGFEAGGIPNKYQDDKYFVGEDQSLFELPFEIIGILEDSVELHVTLHDWIADETGEAATGDDVILKEDVIILSKGNEWNLIPFDIFDDEKSLKDKKFIVRLESVVSDDTLVVIDQAKRECIVTIRNIERNLQVTDTLVDVHEYTTEKLTYKFNLTAIVEKSVTATVVVDTSNSTALEGVHFEIVDPYIEIIPGETEATIDIIVKDDHLGNEDRIIILKLKDVVGIPVSETRATGKVVIINDDNSVGFAETSQFMLSGTELNVPITIKGLRNEKLSVEFEIIEITAEEGKDFLVLSTDAVVQDSAATSFIRISGLSVETDKKFKIRLTKLKGETLTIKSIIDPNYAECEIDILVGAVDKTLWKVLSGPGAMDSDPMTNLFDGDDDNMWHSDYNNGPTKPWVFVIDMNKFVPINEVRLARRSGRTGDARHIKFYISEKELPEDSGEWKEIIDDNEGTALVKNFDIPGTPIARYFKFEILEGRGDGEPKVAAFGEITINPQ